MDNKNNSKKDGLSDRINQIRLILCNGKNNDFAAKIGKSWQYASALCSGKKQAGKGIVEEILAAFPQVSKVWLYLGEGEMLITDKPEQGKELQDEVAQLKRTIAQLSDYNDMLKGEIARLKAQLKKGASASDEMFTESI